MSASAKSALTSRLWRTPTPTLRLVIHRTTVIYRLDQISRLTSRDVREPAVAVALYLACLIGD